MQTEQFSNVSNIDYLCASNKVAKIVDDFFLVTRFTQNASRFLCAVQPAHSEYMHA